MADSPAERKARAKAGSTADRAMDAAVSSVPGGKAVAGVLSGKTNAQDAATTAFKDALSAKVSDAIPGMGVFNLAKSIYDTSNTLAAGKKLDPKIKEELMANALASATGMPPSLAKFAIKEIAENPNIKKGDFDKELGGAVKELTGAGQRAWKGASEWLSDSGLSSAFTSGANAVTSGAAAVGGFLGNLTKNLPKSEGTAPKTGNDFSP